MQAQPSQKSQRIRSKIMNLSDVISKIKKYGGKIPTGDFELLKNTEYWIKDCMSKIKLKIEPALLEEYTNLKQLINNNQHAVCMDLEHIINCHYELVQDSSGAFYSINFKGGHRAGTLCKLEQEGLIKIKSLIEFGGGCIEYQAEDLFTGRMFKHTEFPTHWNTEKIANETYTIANKYLNNLSETLTCKKSIKYVGSENFKLQIIIAPELLGEYPNIKIITAHPIFEGS